MQLFLAIQNKLFCDTIEQFVQGILNVVMTLQYKRMRELREDHDYTQANIGEKLHISQRTYAYYESGERMVPPNILSALADIYDVSVDYILERTNFPKTNM